MAAYLIQVIVETDETKETPHEVTLELINDAVNIVLMEEIGSSKLDEFGLSFTDTSWPIKIVQQNEGSYFVGDKRD